MRNRVRATGLLLVGLVISGCGSVSGDHEHQDNHAVDAVAKMPGVQGASEWDLRMRPTATTQQTIAALRRLTAADLSPDIEQGKVLIEHPDNTTDDRIPLLAPVGALDLAPISVVDINDFADGPLLSLVPSDDGPAKAAAAVSDVVRALAETHVTGLASLTVEHGGPSMDPVTLSADVLARPAAARAMLAAATAMGAEFSRLTASGADDALLTLTSDSARTVDATWQRGQRAVSAQRAPITSLEVSTKGFDVWGAVGVSPKVATAFARALDNAGVAATEFRAYSDRTQVSLASLAKSETVTKVASTSHITTLELSLWPADGPQQVDLVDSPTVVADLAPRAAALARSGYEITWDGRRRSGPSELTIGNATYTDRVDQLFKDVRAFRWPGTARVRVDALRPPGACASDVASVDIVSTATGRATSVRTSDCDRAAAAVRKAWNATSPG